MKAALIAGLAAAQAFAPIVSPGAFDAPAACYYRMLPAPAGTVRILYWFSWPDERHPSSLIDAPYRLWRRLTYGTREDLEFVLVEADARTRKPTRLVFESPITGALLVRHVPRDLAEFPASATHPLLAVASWNHLYEPGGRGGAALPAQEMTDELYARLRMDRRSRPPDVEE